MNYHVGMIPRLVLLLITKNEIYFEAINLKIKVHVVWVFAGLEYVQLSGSPIYGGLGST